MNANEDFILGFLVHKLDILLSQCWTKKKPPATPLLLTKSKKCVCVCVCVCVRARAQAVKWWDFYFFYNFLQKNDSNNKYWFNISCVQGAIHLQISRNVILYYRWWVHGGGWGQAVGMVWQMDQGSKPASQVVPICVPVLFTCVRQLLSFSVSLSICTWVRDSP